MVIEDSGDAFTNKEQAKRGTPDSVPTPAKQYVKEATISTSVDEDRDHIKLIKTRAKIIRTQLDQGADPEGIDGYLGEGHHGKAYFIEGKVVKIFDTDQQDVEEEVQRLELSRGIPHTIQLVDADAEERMIITELLPGENIMHQSDGNPVQYTDAELIELIHTIDAVNKQGLIIDPKPGNFNYDSDTGFYVLDVLNAFPGIPYSLAEQVMGLRHMLTYDGPYRQKSEEVLLADERYNYQTTTRLVRIVRDNFPDLYEEVKRKDRELKDKGRGFIHEPMYPEDSDVQSELGQLRELGLSVLQT